MRKAVSLVGLISIFSIILFALGIAGFPIPAEAAGGTAVRDLPATYTPGIPFNVTITVVPNGATETWVLEENVPPSWTVTAIDQEGVANPNGSLRWGVFRSDVHPNSIAHTFTYTIKPPLGESGSKTFTGKLSLLDSYLAYLEVTTTGPASITKSLTSATYHPADTSRNYSIETSEALNYASCWKRLCTTANPPVPIPAFYLTAATSFWKRTGPYHYVSTPACTPTSPQCFIVGS